MPSQVSSTVSRAADGIFGPWPEGNPTETRCRVSDRNTTVVTPAVTGRPGAPARLEQVADGVFAYVQPDGGWCVNNAGLVVAGGRSLLVDTTATEARTRALRRAVLGVAPGPPRYLVNTHSHGDHTFGNFLFPEAVIAGHSGTRAGMLEVGLHLTGLWPDVAWGDIEVTPPTLTYESGIVLEFGGVRVEVRAMGTAHTREDSVVWLPEQRVLFTGDLVMSGTAPFFPMGSLSGSLAAVRALRALEPRTVVAGHGPVGGAELLAEAEGYLLWVRQLAAEGHAAGRTPRETAAAVDHSAWSHLREAERLVPNLHRAYLELSGAAPGEPIDMGAVFQDMVEYGGGLPRCEA